MQVSSIELDSVSKRFGSVEVISELSLTIHSGEFIAFLGPSGCGKSTLLRMIAGLESVDGGEIRIGGERVDHLPPGARGVAMVFQHYALYPHMTVFDNLAFGLRNIGTPENEIARRIEEAARILEIGHLLKRKPGQLSGGQRQRVAIGRALVKDPKAYLFDEPLSNLDAKLRAHTRLEIQKLHRELGITSLFVTHDQVEAMTLAQRMIVMNGGVMEQFGTPEEVYTRPATTFVATFIGSPPMNLIKEAPGLKSGVTLGVRPEHLDITSDGWALTVDALETLGAERLVYGRWQHAAGQELVIIRTDEAVAPPVLGSTIHVTPRPDRLHYFDSTTGRRLNDG